MSGAPARTVPDRIANILMFAGAGLAVAAVVAWVSDVMPALPAWMLRLAIYKLMFASAAGLVIIGAVLRRAVGGYDRVPARLGEGEAPTYDVRAGEGDRAASQLEDRQ